MGKKSPRIQKADESTNKTTDEDSDKSPTRKAGYEKKKTQKKRRRHHRDGRPEPTITIETDQGSQTMTRKEWETQQCILKRVFSKEANKGR